MSASPLLDFRSDTTTVPNEAMLSAMMSAPVGDSVYDEDPSELKLQEEVASLAGKEAALFVATGTMSNQIALRVHRHRSSVLYPSVLFGQDSHLGFRELGGPAVNSGISAIEVPINAETRQLDAASIQPLIHKDHDLHSSTAIGICVENTMAGQILSLDELRKIRELCDEHNLFLHMDGARLWNAAAATNTAVKDWTSLCDTVSLCLSKGMGAPIGSVLVGDKEFIHDAKEVRKAFGGGWRQCGYLAAACSYAIENNFARLKDDHANATFIFKQLSTMGFSMVEPHTNVITVTKCPDGVDALVPVLRKDHGIAFAPSRIVTHLNTPRADCEKFVGLLRRLIKK